MTTIREISDRRRYWGLLLPSDTLGLTSHKCKYWVDFSQVTQIRVDFSHVCFAIWLKFSNKKKEKVQMKTSNMHKFYVFLSLFFLCFTLRITTCPSVPFLCLSCSAYVTPSLGSKTVEWRLLTNTLELLTNTLNPLLLITNYFEKVGPCIGRAFC